MTSFNPILSIITINYNDKVGLERTLKSVVTQTYKAFEFLVIDGGSTDGSKELIEANKANINYWVSEPDKGIYNAMNKGILKANGEYLLFINSGDELFSPTVLEENIQFIHTEDLIYFNINVVGKQESFIKKYPSNITFSYLFEDTLPHPATCIKKSLFAKIGLYDETLKIVSDWKWFILALVKHNVNYKYYNTVFSTFYLDGISSQKESVTHLLKERNLVLNTEFPLFTEDTKSLIELRKTVADFKNSRKTKWLTKFNLINRI